MFAFMRDNAQLVCAVGAAYAAVGSFASRNLHRVGLFMALGASFVVAVGLLLLYADLKVSMTLQLLIPVLVLIRICCAANRRYARFILIVPL
jgi:hypothetical protein